MALETIVEALPVEEFVTRLNDDNQEYYATTPPELKTYWPHRLVGEAAIEALKARWSNEYLATIVLSRLVEKVDHPKVKMLVARQVGDEAKHAQVTEKRIRQLGGRVEDYVPPTEQMTLYRFLDEVEHPEEFIGAMQFTTEAEGARRNEQALSRFDRDTAQMFYDAINPDEAFHVQIGWTGLRILCTTPESQERARLAAYRQRDLHRDWTAAYRRRMQERNLL